MRKHPALRDAPTGKVVDAAWARLQAAAQECNDAALPGEVAEFLDRIGFEGLDRPESIKRMQQDTSRVLSQLFGRPWTFFGESRADAVLEALSLEMVSRLGELDPTGPGWDTTNTNIGVTWLNLNVRRIVEHLPDTETGAWLLSEITQLPIVSCATPTSVQETQMVIVSHPRCPEDFLRQACLSGGRVVAREAMRNPACPPDAQVAVALRFPAVA